GIVAGESGAAGLAGLTELTSSAHAEARSILGIDSSTRVLLFSTEGATDPEGYQKIVEGEYVVPNEARDLKLDDLRLLASLGTTRLTSHVSRLTSHVSRLTPPPTPPSAPPSKPCAPATGTRPPRSASTGPQRRQKSGGRPPKS